MLTSEAQKAEAERAKAEAKPTEQAEPEAISEATEPVDKKPTKTRRSQKREKVAVA